MGLVVGNNLNMLCYKEDDGTNQMIQDLFSQPDEDGENADIYDEPLLEKTNKRLYEGSKENSLSATLLLVNLKVMNNLLNTCMTQILRYVIYFISYCTYMLIFLYLFLVLINV
jgi:hypothetical protein